MDDMKKIILYLYTVFKQPSMEVSVGYLIHSVEKNTGLVRPPCTCRHNNTPDMHAYLS